MDSGTPLSLVIRAVEPAEEARAAALGEAASLLGVDVTDLRIEGYCPDCGRDHGRPVVRRADGGDVDVWVSIAHARNRSWIAATLEGPIGVDVEAVDQPVGRVEAITSALGDDPASGAAAKQEPSALLRRWTSVEAVLKADGRGLRVDPSAVSIGAHGTAAILEETARYRLLEVEQPPGYALSVAVRL